jgi:hypothetical protein
MKLIKATKSEYTKVKQIKIKSPLISRILIALILLVVISFFINIKLVLFIGLVIFFNATLERFRLARGLPTDFELSTISTVLVTMVFGLGWGIFNAIFTKLITSISTGNVLADHFFMIATYINAAIITAVFRTANVFVLGVIIVFINATIMFLISKNILGLPPHENLSYTVSNVAFNFLVFSIFSEFILRILTL